MRAYFNAAEKGIQTKADMSPVTLVDKQINQMLIDEVADHFPDHGVLGEEASTVTDKHDSVWVCDPVDGTLPFIIGLPTAMFSLAFVYKGEPLIGVAYDPFLDRMFVAIKGQGAKLNGHSIHVDSGGMKGARIAGPTGVNTLLRSQELYNDLQARGAHVTAFPGNVYKCTLLAEGRMHGRIFSGHTAHDIAALKVIVEEAGGRVTDLDGNEQRYDRPIRGAIVSNGVIHDQLLEAVRHFGGAQKVMQV